MTRTPENEGPSGGAAATPFANISTGQWNAMVMQPDGVGQEVLNVSFLSHANGVFNHTVGLLVRMGLLYEGHDCTYDEFEAAFSKLVTATAYYRQEHEERAGPAWECDHCPQPSSMACISNIPDGLTGCNNCQCVFGRDGLHMRARQCERTPQLLAEGARQCVCCPAPVTASRIGGGDWPALCDYCWQRCQRGSDGQGGVKHTHFTAGPVPTAGGTEPCGHCVEQVELETGGQA